MYEEVTEGYVKSVIPPRHARSRKGENGVVCVLGGSNVYHGAPTLSALACYRTGVDLVYVVVPEKVATAVRSISPSLIVLPIPNSKLNRVTVSRVVKALPQLDCVVLGPGLTGQKPEGLALVAREFASRGASLVVDASALVPDILEALRGQRVVITPHAGEFKRLFGFDPGKGLEEKVKSVEREALNNSLTILLKGVWDVVSDGRSTLINKTGSPSMTVGGTGDTLSGIVAGLLAKGVEPVKAAAAAAWINGSAGQLATDKYGLHILPTDLIDEIPTVMKGFDRVED